MVDAILEDKEDYNFVLLMGDISYADGKQARLSKTTD